MTHPERQEAGIADFLLNASVKSYKLPGFDGITLVHSSSQETRFRETALAQGYGTWNMGRSLVSGSTIYHTYLTYDVSRWEVEVFVPRDAAERKAEMAKKMAEGWSWDPAGSRIVFHKAVAPDRS